MKIEQAIVLYLLKNKYLSLQGIGTFKIEGTFPDISDDKPYMIPAEAVSFVYDPKTKEDPELINFIVQTTKKIYPLASADLDSFLTLGCQFLNIGKPFVIHNLGVLEKAGAAGYEFKGGPVIQRPEIHPAKIEDATLESTDESTSFNEYENAPSRGSGRSLLYIFVLVLLVAAGWITWKYIFEKHNSTTVNTNTGIIPVQDTTQQTAKQADSLQMVQKADSLKNISKNLADTFTFKVVTFESTDSAIARRRMEKWINMGRKIILYTDDSVTYKIAHPFTLPLSDTTRILDSLNNYYYRGKAHIELGKRQ